MKKLLFVSLALLSIGSALKAQAPTYTTVTDTVHYYYHKHYYTQNGPPWGFLPYTPGPAFHNISYVGSKFENKDTLVVSGLEGFSGMASKRSSQLSMPVALYLCNLGTDGLPVLPALDSVYTVVGNTLTVKVGGDFPNGRTRVLTKDYAVLMRNMSQHSGDSIKLVRTSAKTYTAWAAVNGPTWRDKYSDGMGVIRYLGKFYSTTNFTLTGFGKGTDYEFLVAPRVQYNLRATQTIPQKVVDNETICTWDKLTFTNTSSWRYTNRFYNFLEFNARWNHDQTVFHYLLAPPTGFPTDSAITWFFRDQDNGQAIPDPRKCLGRDGGTNSIVHYSDSTGCFDDNRFIARLKPMNYYTSIQANMVTASEIFTLCLDFCGVDAVGLKTNTLENGLNVYPNPAVSGKTSLSGLVGSNTIYVYDVLGQVVYKELTNKEQVTIDLSNKPNGNYIVRVVSDLNKSKTVKIVKQD